MKVDVQSPEEYLGEIIGDINSRRGQVSEWVVEMNTLIWYNT